MAKEVIRARATPAQITGIQPGTADRLVSCEAVANLYLLVTPKGKKSWRWQAKLADGTNRKLTLGQWGAYSVNEAREWARARNAERDRGDDPKALAEAERESIRESAAPVKTTRALFDDFLATKDRLRTVVEKRRLMERNVLPWIGDKVIGDVKKADIRACLDRMAERGARASANRVLAEVKPFFDWCAERDLVAVNVAATIRKDKYAEGNDPRRDIPLHELAIMWRAADTFPVDQRDFFRLLILTGCRRNESSGARLAEYRDGEWTLPRERAKMKKPAILSLGPIGREIFESRQDSGRDLLFAGYWHKELFKKPIEKFHTKVEELAPSPLAGWDIHSIRHGVRTEFGRQGCCTPDIARRIISHSVANDDLGYDHGLYTAEKAAALLAWENVLMREVRRQEAEAEAAAGR